MAGNSDPLKPDSKDFVKPVGPQARSFSCPSCGAAVTIRCPGETLSVVCDSCLSIIDTTDENYKILHQYFSRTKLYKTRIPFGTRGVLNGRKWECIGFVARKDSASSFIWEEYLLFNPYYGYRWLTLNNGHWSLVTVIKRKPSVSAPYAKLDNERYRLFYKGTAEYLYVLGEFYWKVSVGKKVWMEDYVNPPYMLSLENEGSFADSSKTSSAYGNRPQKMVSGTMSAEIVWAQSEYLPAKEVAKAFKLKERDFPSRKGIAPNQPIGATKSWQSMLKTWLLCMVALTGLQLFHVASSSSEVVDREGFSFVTNMKVVDLTTKKFTITKPNRATEITLYAPCDNSWLYLDGAMVNNKTGDSFPLGLSIEYYHGYSDGESWSEGGQTASATLPAVPPGEYYITMDLQSGDFKDAKQQRGCTLSVISDVPQWGNWWWCMFLVAILPCWYAFLSYCYEASRWSESDYSPFPSSSE
jgi:hypothetical protein